MTRKTALVLSLYSGRGEFRISLGGLAQGGALVLRHRPASHHYLLRSPNEQPLSIATILFILNPNTMWNIDYVNDMINVKSELIQDKESFIREVDFNRDITQAVLSRSNLLQQVTQLEEIRDEMQKCLDHEDTNEYISQFALVYTLIEKYKAERDAERDQPLS